MSIRSFRDLLVWQRAMRLAERVYGVTSAFPSSERFGLVFQLRKAAASIPCNIAEGHERSTRAYLYHLHVAIGSNAELQTQLELSHRVGLVPESTVRPVLNDAEDVGRLLRRLTAAVDRRVQMLPARPLRESEPGNSALNPLIP